MPLPVSSISSGFQAQLSTSSQCEEPLLEKVLRVSYNIFQEVIIPLAKKILYGLYLGASFLSERLFSVKMSPEKTTALYQKKVEASVMAEYVTCNPQDASSNRLKEQLVFIKALLDEKEVTGLQLCEKDKKVCEVLADIARRVYKVKHHFPRDNQLISTLLFLEGKKTSLAQIKTGQGKTLIAAMTAIARKKLYNEKVCVLTTTEPLAFSGFQEMQKLYEACSVSVACFDRTGFVKKTNSSGSCDVIYSTSFSLKCDKIAKKKGGAAKLNFWEKAPLSSSKQDLCFIVDECDSVLYDHAGSRVQSTIPMPFQEDLVKLAHRIAEKTKEFYQTQQNPSKIPSFMKSLKEQTLDQISSHKDPFFKWYVKQEVDQWVLDAVKVMNPKDSFWRDGVRYLKSPSMAKDLANLFVQSHGFYKDLQLTLGKKKEIEQVLQEGLDLHDLLMQVQKKKVVKEGEVKVCVQKLTAFMPRFIRVFTGQELIEALKRPEHEHFKESLFAIYARYKQFKENSQASPQFLKDLLVNSHIRYIEEGTAQIVENLKFSHLTHLFLEYKEYEKIVSIPTTALDLQSQLDVLRDASCIVGFTGSLPNEKTHPEEFQHFKGLIERAYTKKGEATHLKTVPDFTKSKKMEEAPVICETENEWQGEVIKEIQKKKSSQALLIVCKNPKEALEMEAFLKSKKDKQLLPQGLYLKKEDEKVIQASYNAGDIVITTALGARGTDWHVKAKKGFHVLCTYKPNDFRTQTQISGRAARSGQEGSYREISLQSKEERKSFDKVDAELRQAVCHDLFSSLYRLFNLSVLNPQDKQRLVLWMSASSIRAAFLSSIENKLQEKSCGDADLQLCLSAFCKCFHKGQIKPSLQQKFEKAISNWIKEQSY